MAHIWAIRAQGFHIMTRVTPLIGLSIILLAVSVCAGAKTPMLMQNSEAIRYAVADAYTYAIIDQFDREEEISDSEFVPISEAPFKSACSPEQSKKIDNIMLRQVCRVTTISINNDCQDKNGCIELGLHPDILKDSELAELLQAVIRSPCRYIPNESRFHWVSLYYPNWVSYGILNCENNRLPYTKAYILYGADRREVDL